MPTSTITGNIRSISHTVRGNVKILFTPTLTPFVDNDSHVITTTPKLALTDAAGDFTIDLVDGTYTVWIYQPDGVDYDTLTIVVPSTQGTYDISTLITSSAATAGNFSSSVNFDAPYAIGSGEYLGGRVRWSVLAVIKSASLVINNQGPVGASFTVALEVNGSLVSGQTITLSAGEVSGAATLSNVQVTAGQYVRWKVTAAPSAPENFPSNVFLTMNVTT